MGIAAHPYADLFPMMPDGDSAGLRTDLAENGQRERIILLDDKILDGRNRQRALEALGLVDGYVPPEGSDLWIARYRRFVPAQDGDPLAFVLSLNLHRRHLNEGQRAMVAERLATMRQGERTDLGANSSQPSANLPKVSTQDAADLLHVSERSVRSARQVREQGAPELVERVERGDVAVSTAAELASLPVGEQLRILRENHPREFSRAVREQRDRPADARSVMNSRQQPPDDLDYSPTPPWGTRCLLQHVLPHLGQSLTGLSIREPACGEGHISAVLQEARPAQILASDIFDYSVDGVSPVGWQGVADYLDDAVGVAEPDWTIMNPPFGDKAERFAHRALRESRVGVAMLVRLGWLDSIGRYERLFASNPPTLIAIFVERLPLHMGRWEPDGSTATPYCWLVWIKGAEPRAPFWIPPGQRVALSKPDDVARFTAHPVVGLADAAVITAAKSSALAMDKATALPIIAARYTGENGQQLADELGRPLNTIRKWAFEAGVTSQARNTARIQSINAGRGQ